VDPTGLKKDTQGIATDKRAAIGRMPSFDDNMGIADKVKWALFLKSRTPIQENAPITATEQGNSVAAFIAQNYPQLRGYGDKIEVEETYVMEGDPIYLIGTAQNDDWNGGGHLIIKNDGKNPFYICDGIEKDAKKNLGTTTYLSMLGGPVLFLVSAFLLLTIYIRMGADEALLALGTISALMYAYAGLIYFLEMYNGMVLLKAQTEMARGNLHALYKRRNDLIPLLETIVKGASRHEKELQEAIANIRQQALADKDKSIIGMMEAYPQLMANENFLKFQQELSDTETWIAGGRSFLVESITLYNTRIMTFPYSALAKIGGFQPISMEIG